MLPREGHSNPFLPSSCAYDCINFLGFYPLTGSIRIISHAKQMAGSDFWSISTAHRRTSGDVRYHATRETTHCCWICPLRFSNNPHVQVWLSNSLSLALMFSLSPSSSTLLLSDSISWHCGLLECLTVPAPLVLLAAWVMDCTGSPSILL